jgi:hypothetical protein
MNGSALLQGATDSPAIQGHRLETLQVNVGCLCNQQCMHCHVLGIKLSSHEQIQPGYRI